MMCSLQLKILRGLMFSMAISGLFGCASSDRPKPTELVSETISLSPQTIWTSRIGEVRYAMQPGIQGQALGLAASDGTVLMLDLSSGKEIWRASAGDGISAGASTDGQLISVVTQSNDVVVLKEGSILWKHRLGARSFTPPLIAGGRIFVLAADRSVTALDALSGQRLWVQNRQQNEALVVQQNGVILPVGDTLVVGLSGRVQGLNPSNGSVRWDVPVSFARGGNDIERLVDIVGPASRVGSSLCVRSFQTAVGCLDAEKGLAKWSMLSRGAVGVAGSATHLFSTESDGKIQAWLRTTGDKSWSNEKFLHRGLTAPATTKGSVAVGDSFGYVHLLSPETGTVIGRMQSDSSPIVALTSTQSDKLIVIHRSGVISTLSF